MLKDFLRTLIYLNHQANHVYGIVLHLRRYDMSVIILRDIMPLPILP